VRLRSFFVALVMLLVSRSAAADEPPPTSPKSPAGYPEPIAQPDASSHAVVDNSPYAHDGHPLAGYHNGLFFLRDHHDNFHLYIQGRMQLDWFSFFGKGVSDTALHPTLFVRRIRPEISGEFLGHWRFMIAGDFGATALDNANGMNELLAAPPGAAPTGTTARFAPADTTRFQAAATDAFINYRNSSVFNIEVGQMDAPFTMENKTSDKYLPFMERSLAVRAVAIPTNKEMGAMVWGETENRVVYYSVGPYMGDGQNRPNVDSRMDVFARSFVHPFATASWMAKDNPFRDAQVGASFHYGSRDRKWVNYDYPVMTTQGAVAFWSPVYRGAKGNTHVIPAGDQLAVAYELRVPIDRFDVTSEFAYVQNGTREAIEGLQSTSSERFGRIWGYSYYAMVGYWVFGRRDINGVPGYGNPPRLDWSRTDPVVPDQALQILAKWEQVALQYRGASRSGQPDAKGIDGDIKVNALSFGANYWATKHVRLSLNYIYDMFGTQVPLAGTKPLDSLHELLARFAIAL
jgi:phosphate-selective porin